MSTVLSKLGLGKSADQTDTLAEQGRAPASAVNAIMGQLGLARPEGEPEADEEALAAGLADPSWSVRVATVQKLGHLGQHAPLELLLVALRDEQSSVRAAAARALTRNPRPAALPALIATLTDTAWVVRAEAARALGKLADPESLETLLVTARDPDPAVRSASLLALAEIGGTSSVDLLNAALSDEDSSVREAATLALAQLADPAAIPALLNARLDQDQAVRTTAEEGLQHLYPEFDPMPLPPSDSFAQWLTRIEASQTPYELQEAEQIESTPSDALVEKLAEAQTARRWKAIKLLRRDAPEMTLPTLPSRGVKLAETAQHIPDAWTHKLALLGEALVSILILVGLVVTWLILANRPDVSPVKQTGPSAFTIYREHISSVEKLAWSPNGRVMASADLRGTVRIWQVGSGRTITPYTQAGRVLALTWYDAETLLAVYGGPGPALQIQEINIHTSPPLVQTIFQRFNLPGTPQTADWSPDSSNLAFDTGNGEVQVWTITPGAPQYLFTLPATPLNQVLWSPDGNQLATIATQGQLRIWDASTGTLLANLPTPQAISSASWIICGNTDNGLIYAYAQGAVMEWCPAQNSKNAVVFLSAQAYNLKGSHNLSVGAIALSANQNQVLLATSDGLVQIRDAHSGNIVYVYAGHSAQVNVLTWSPNDRSVATAGMDTTVQIWQEA